MNMHAVDPEITAKWDSGEFGRSEEHVLVVSDDESRALDSDLAMKLVSIRLPVPLIEALKHIAKYRGIAYQPMVRDLLTRFATSEIRQIAIEFEDRVMKAREEEASLPVDSLMERTKVAAAG